MPLVDLDAIPQVPLDFINDDHREEARLLNELAEAVEALRAGRVERGGLVVCSALVRGQRLTLSLVRTADGWRLSEWAGFANRDPRPAELAALRPWLEANRIEVRGGRRR